MNYKYFYILDKDYNLEVLGKYKLYDTNERNGVKNVDRNRNDIGSGLEVSEHTDRNDLFGNGSVEGREAATNDDKFSKKALQAERRSDATGCFEDGYNDNTGKGKYSRDVDYQEFYDLKRENKHLKEVQSIDVLYAVNAKKEVAALDEPEFRPINGTALTTSTISIFNLLDYVNNCFPDILPEERKISVSSFSICLIMQAKTSTAELRLKIILSILSILITKNKGNNDDTANAKALASTSETSVGNVSFNSSISNLIDYVNNCSPDILPEEQKKDMLNYHAK